MNKFQELEIKIETKLKLNQNNWTWNQNTAEHVSDGICFIATVLSKDLKILWSEQVQRNWKSWEDTLPNPIMLPKQPKLEVQICVVISRTPERRPRPSKRCLYTGLQLTWRMFWTRPKSFPSEGSWEVNTLFSNFFGNFIHFSFIFTFSKALADMLKLKLMEPLKVVGQRSLLNFCYICWKMLNLMLNTKAWMLII